MDCIDQIDEIIVISAYYRFHQCTMVSPKAYVVEVFVSRSIICQQKKSQHNQASLKPTLASILEDHVEIVNLNNQPHLGIGRACLVKQCLVVY